MRQAGDFAFPDVASLGNSAGDGRIRRLTGDGELYEDVAGGWRKVRADTLKTLTLFTSGSFNQSVLSPVSLAFDSQQFANSVLAIALPPTFVTTSNTSFLLEIVGKDSTTGSFKMLIVGRVLGDTGTAASWTANSVLTLVGTPPFNSVKFGMSAASPKTPMIILGDGTTALNYPTYVVEKLTIIGPTANTLYTAGTGIAMSVVPQNQMAATFTVQNTVSPNVLAVSYASLVSASLQAFLGQISAPGLITSNNLLFNRANAPYSAGMIAEDYGTGLLLDFGANYDQLNNLSGAGVTTSGAWAGGYFRIDTRTGFTNEFFSVTYIPPGSGTSQSREQKIFTLGTDGTLKLGTALNTVLTAASAIDNRKITYSTAQVTASRVVTLADYHLFCNASAGAIVLTLPAASTCQGQEFVVKKIDSSANPVTLTTATNNIDGTATKVLSTQYSSYTVVSDGTTWWVV